MPTDERDSTPPEGVRRYVEMPSTPAEEIQQLIQRAIALCKKIGDLRRLALLKKALKAKDTRGASKKYDELDERSAFLLVRERAKKNPNIRSVDRLCEMIANEPWRQGYSKTTKSKLRHLYQAYCRHNGLDPKTAYRADADEPKPAKN
jgi:hypothetical protein